MQDTGTIVSICLGDESDLIVVSVNEYEFLAFRRYDSVLLVH